MCGYIFICVYKNEVEPPHRCGAVEQNTVEGLGMCWPALPAEAACQSVWP